MKILICGLPGSGKSTLAEPFAELIGGIWLNADKIRTEYDDWDFSVNGRLRQADRMRHLADGIVMCGKIAVADFVCPLQWTRDAFDADYTVWMDTIKEGPHVNTNKMFERPEEVDYHVAKWFNDTHAELVKVVENYMQKQDDIKNDRTAGTTSGRL